MPTRIAPDGEALNAFSVSQSMPKELQKQHLDLLLTLHSSSRHDDLPSPWIAYPQHMQRVIYKIRRSTATWLFSRILIGENDLLRYLQSFDAFSSSAMVTWHPICLNYAINGVPIRRLWYQKIIDQHSSLHCGLRSTALVEGPSDAQQSRPSPNAPTEDDSIKRFRQRELDALLVKASLGTDAEDNLKGYSLRILDAEEENTMRKQFSELLPFPHLRCHLTFELCWPIDLLLSQTDLATYSELWALLMGLKHVQMSLSRLWKVLRGESTAHHQSSKENHETDEDEDESGYRERVVWRLRSHMQYWVDTLWCHLQVQKKRHWYGCSSHEGKDQCD